MITKLRGILDSYHDSHIVIDVAGVGYSVHASHSLISHLPDIGQPIIVLTELIVREDAHILLGFDTPEERDWYRLLISVQGVGMRVAFSLLSLGDPQTLSQYIRQQDKAFVARAEGVGPKLASRIVNELKDKVEKLFPYSSASVRPSGLIKTSLLKGNQDAVSALMNLGYRQNEAVEAVEFAMQKFGNDATVEQLIRTGLTRLAS